MLALTVVLILQAAPEEGFVGEARLNHVIGSGSFVSNDALRESGGYHLLMVNLRPGWRMSLGEHTLRLGLRQPVAIAMSANVPGGYDDIAGINDRLSIVCEGCAAGGPSSNPGRRVMFPDASLWVGDLWSLIAGDTNLALNGTVRIYLPTSEESRTAKRTAALHGTVGARLETRRIELSYGVGGRKQFHRDARRVLPPISHELFNTFGLGVKAAGIVTVSYAVVVWHAWRQSVQRSNDPFTAAGADAGRSGAAVILWSTLQVTAQWQTGDASPLQWTAALGLAARHPSETAAGDVQWPIVFNTLTDNRAANNVGSINLTIAVAFPATVARPN